MRALVRRVRSARAAGSLRDVRIWHINSTARGGGVAEMLPRIVSALRELGMATEWLVLSPPENMKAPFFSLTKHLHNLLHGVGAPLAAWAGCGLEGASSGGGKSANELLCSPERQAAGLGEPISATGAPRGIIAERKGSAALEAAIGAGGRP